MGTDKKYEFISQPGGISGAWMWGKYLGIHIHFKTKFKNIGKLSFVFCIQVCLRGQFKLYFNGISKNFFQVI